MTTATMKKSEVGELRPSQLLLTFGVGAIVDLPNMSVMVMGLDDWPTKHATEIGEERLLLSVQNTLGSQVKKLLTPPRAEESLSGQTSWFDEAHQVGVPVVPFPRWMVCPKCRLLAPISSSLFEPKTPPYRPDKARYVHNCTTQGASPTVIPARFLVACKHGHLDDFPWLEFIHKGQTECKGPLRMYELGVSGEAADVEVKCEKCNAVRRMAEAFGRDNESNMPPCKGRHPHLRMFDSKGCDEGHVTAILQGASNSWFSVMLTALSVPHSTDKLAQMVVDNWVTLEKATSLEILQAFRMIGQLKEFADFKDVELWEAVEKKRSGGPAVPAGEPTSLKRPEWEIFSQPSPAYNTRDFRLKVVPPPEGYASFFEKIVLAEKLREVRALIGFTRLESACDFDTPTDLPIDLRAPLTRQAPSWVPASEIRGEGIFFHFSEKALQKWEKEHGAYDGEFFNAHKRWKESRGMPKPDAGYPEIRFVLLHTFAHAVIRQLSIECGYTTASIRERIYCQSPAAGEPMAGVLIYTAAADSEGTLGGLCALGRPDRLGSHLNKALEMMRLCASDPLCAERHPGREGVTLHGAACHACTFVPETSCERGNKYLDRSVLVETVERGDLAFFE
ncbi:MAG: DUF1998 domain-containing protein [Planctomycetota bacterium]